VGVGARSDRRAVVGTPACHRRILGASPQLLRTAVGVGRAGRTADAAGAKGQALRVAGAGLLRPGLTVLLVALARRSRALRAQRATVAAERAGAVLDRAGPAGEAVCGWLADAAADADAVGVGRARR